MGAIAVVQFLIFVLELVETEVDATEPKQFLVSALFAKAPLVEDQDAIGMLDSAEAVSDDERSPAGKQAVQSSADEQFSLGVNTRRSFIKNEVTGIMR